MKIETNELGNLELTEVYNPIKLVTNVGEELVITMRDSGFEFTYQGTKYSAIGGIVSELIKSVSNLETEGIPTTNGTTEFTDNVVEVTEKLYYESNPSTKMDVPSFAYKKVAFSNRRRIKAQSKLSLYDWCKQEMG